MSRLHFNVLFAAVCLALVSPAVAATTWDAYDGFIPGPDAQSSSSVWQYFQNPAHYVNSGYTLFDKWGATGAGDGWTSVSPDDGWFFVAKDAVNGELLVSPWGTDPYTTKAAVIGWKSPVDGVVNASFSVTDRNGSPGNDGVRYWLYKGGTDDSAYLEQGNLAEGGASGTIVHNNISVAMGDMLYLRVDPNGGYYCDLTGVTFSVSEVPEPNAIVLVLSGILGLVCYAWRKRR